MSGGNYLDTVTECASDPSKSRPPVIETADASLNFEHVSSSSNTKPALSHSFSMDRVSLEGICDGYRWFCTQLVPRKPRVSVWYGEDKFPWLDEISHEGGQFVLVGSDVNDVRNVHSLAVGAGFRPIIVLVENDQTYTPTATKRRAFERKGYSGISTPKSTPKNDEPVGPNVSEIDFVFTRGHLELGGAVYHTLKSSFLEEKGVEATFVSMPTPAHVLSPSKQSTKGNRLFTRSFSIASGDSHKKQEAEGDDTITQQVIIKDSQARVDATHKIQFKCLETNKDVEVSGLPVLHLSLSNTPMLLKPDYWQQKCVEASRPYITLTFKKLCIASILACLAVFAFSYGSYQSTLIENQVLSGLVRALGTLPGMTIHGRCVVYVIFHCLGAPDQSKLLYVLLIAVFPLIIFLGGWFVINPKGEFLGDVQKQMADICRRTPERHMISICPRPDGREQFLPARHSR